VNNKRIFTSSVTLLTFVCFLFVIVIGCTSSSTGYKQLLVDKGMTHFSFEYPARWEKTVEIGEDYSDVWVFAPALIRDKTKIPSSSWDIFVIPVDEEWPDAEAVINDTLVSWKSMPDYELIERSTTELNGVPAEQIVLHYGALTEFPWQESEPIVHTEICFDYGGFVWSIADISNQEVADINKTHFTHMLETFQFLD
jgi:hypothetical protein